MLLKWQNITLNKSNNIDRSDVASKYVYRQNRIFQSKLIAFHVKSSVNIMNI